MILFIVEDIFKTDGDKVLDGDMIFTLQEVKNKIHQTEQIGQQCQ
jgi:hypothetical protein